MQRKVFSAELKAKVAPDALAGRKTVNEIAGAYGAHPHQVATWKREAQEVRQSRIVPRYPASTLQ